MHSILLEDECTTAHLVTKSVKVKFC